MAKIRGRSGEGLSGLVGNVVFYNYKGQQCVRTVQRKRAKNSWSEKSEVGPETFHGYKGVLGPI